MNGILPCFAHPKIVFGDSPKNAPSWSAVISVLRLAIKSIKDVQSVPGCEVSCIKGSTDQREFSPNLFELYFSG
jgi:hypothetical protein